jgi:hypothetical protein
MNGDRRKLATNLIIVGAVLFLIGMFDHDISNLIEDAGSDLRIRNWGWVLQLIGGIIAIYGFTIHLELYLTTGRTPFQPGLPQPLQQYSHLDPETKKIIWLVLIVMLVLYVISPGFQCFSLVIVLLILLIFINMRGRLGPQYPYPPPQYPPPQQPPYQKLPTEAPTQAPKVTLCEKCYAQLELEWAACPFCGHPREKKNENKEKNRS